MKAYFDEIAPDYDVGFSESITGKMQRNRVWHFLETRILPGHKATILEINCGTGVDALWLASKGHDVLATDVSSGMIETASAKPRPANLQFKTAGFGDLVLLAEKNSLDFIFSDFGGLNCIPPVELERFLSDAFGLLKPGGSLALVLMPGFCLWESLYFLLKKPSFTFRRMQTKAPAQGFTHPFDVYYYNPSDLVKMGKGRFHMKFAAPIGFFLPPSCLDGFFAKRPSWMQTLMSLEKHIENLPFLSRMSDHFIIELKKIP